MFSHHDHHRGQMDPGYARVELVLRDVPMCSLLNLQDQSFGVDQFEAYVDT